VPTREVQVDRLDLSGSDGDILHLHVECGSGTYVRSLARDLGERLGCGAHLTALRRLWVEPFREPRMHTLAQLEQVREKSALDGLDALLLPLNEGLAGLPALAVSADQARDLRQGKRLLQPGLTEQPLCRAVAVDGNLVALVAIDNGGEVRVLRGFNAVA